MSGNLIGGAAGVGLSILSGGAFTPMVGWMVGSTVGALAFPPSGPEGPRNNDLKVQGSEYGRPIAIVYSTDALGGNLLWGVVIERDGPGGGKGSGGSPTKAYFGNFAVLICDARDGNMALGRIWAGPEKRLIYDPAGSGTLEGGGTLRFYSGAADQLPDPLMESYKGVGNVPAYRGRCYVVFEEFPLEKDGGRIPFLTIEVGRVGTAAPESLGIVWFHRPMLTSQWAIVPYFGSYRGVIVRDLSDYSFVHNRALDEFSDWGVSDVLFADEARGCYVRVHVAGTNYIATNITTGAVTRSDIPGLVPGMEVRGAALHSDGDYYFACITSTPSTKILRVDPDTNTLVSTFEYDIGQPEASQISSSLMAPPIGDFLIGLTGSKVVRYDLDGTTVTADLGSRSGSIADIDQSTGMIWTVTETDGTLLVSVHHPVAGLNYSASVPTLIRDLAYWPFLFVPGDGGSRPNRAYIIGKKVGTYTDYYEEFDADAGGYIGGHEGAYYGTSELGAAVFDPVTEKLIAFRNGGGAAYAVSSTLDPTTIPYSTGYMGGADSSLQTETLAEIVADLSQRAGLAPSQYDVSALTDTVDGFTVGHQMPVRDALLALAQAYYFDAVESGGLVKFVKRGGAIAAVIPDDDVGAFESGGEPPDPLETTRRMNDELPRRVWVKYRLRATNYDPATKPAQRLVGEFGNEETLELPMVLTDTKAQEVADVNLHTAHVGRIDYRFTLPRAYGYLEPTDVIVVYEHVMRLVRVTQADGVLRCEAVRDDAQTYSPHVVVTETPEIVQEVDVPSLLRLELLGTNMLRDADNDAGVWAAACAADPAATWRGGTLYASSDGGASYTSLGAITSEATIGETTDVLGDFHGGNVRDELNSVNVRLAHGTLASTTAAGFLAGALALVIGDEFLYARDATLEADETYTLRGFLRGRRGTEYAMGTHAAGERVVLVDFATLVRVPQTSADIGLERSYKAVGAGTTLAATTAQAFTNEGNSLKPLAPVHLGGGRDASGNLTIKARRRNRMSGEWRNGVDVPMSEASEAYEVDIYTDGTYTTVKRTISGLTSARASYSAADQTADFGAPQATVYFRFYQLSAIVGRGHAASGSV